MTNAINRGLFFKENVLVMNSQSSGDHCHREKFLCTSVSIGCVSICVSELNTTPYALLNLVCMTVMDSLCSHSNGCYM